MMKLRALMIVLIFQMSIAWSSSTTAMESMPARLVTMYAGDDYTPSYMAPPSEPSMYTSMVTEINVTYVGFPADAQAAFLPVFHQKNPPNTGKNRAAMNIFAKYTTLII